MISSQEGSLMHTFPKLSGSQVCPFDQNQRQFYCSPRFRHAYTPGPVYSTMKGKYFTNMIPEKKFLVFDHSRDQTTVMLNSRPGTPFRCITLRTSKHPVHPGLEDEVQVGKLGSYPESGPTSEIGLDIPKDEVDAATEMHEDTEELNALLYSDDEEGESYYSGEDDEVTSTGHSPSTMTIYEAPLGREVKEEVPCSNRPLKRKRSENDVKDFDDTASSGDVNGKSNHSSNGDDAESSCGEYNDLDFRKNLSSENKMFRSEKVRKILGLLQEMIPGGKGKDGTVVLDEAISYLKTLKSQAEALGFTAF